MKPKPMVLRIAPVSTMPFIAIVTRGKCLDPRPPLWFPVYPLAFYFFV